MNPQQPQQPTNPQQKPTYIAPAPEYYVPPEFKRIPEGQAKPPKNKKRLVIVAIIIGALLVSAGVYFAYSTIHQSVTTSSQPTPALKDVADPNEIIENYTNTSIASRSSQYTQRKDITNAAPSEPVIHSELNTPEAPTNGVIIYHPSNKYATAVSVGDRVQYERNDTTKTNEASVVSETIAFMEKAGFVKQNDSQLGEEVLLTTYDSTNVVCQVSNNEALGSSHATIGLACVNKSVITEQYDFIDSLLALAKDAISTASVTDATIAKTIEDQKQLVALTVSTSESATTLYFATLGTEWEYLGKRPITTADDPNGFTIPADLKKAIQDPKWGTFLSNNIR